MTDAAPPLVRHAYEHGIATLTLDSPHHRNALSSRLIAELADGLAVAAGDDRTRAVLLTHTGTTFCAGADLTEASGSGPRGFTELLRAIVDLPKPVVARITGHVRAGGLGLVGACDIAVAGPAATFAFTEARLGLAPAVVSLPLLPRLDPRAAARYYLTGERFDAAEAARIGLVTLAAGAGRTAGDPKSDPASDPASGAAARAAAGVVGAAVGRDADPNGGAGTAHSNGGAGAAGTAGTAGVDAVLAPLLDGLRRASPQGLAESKRLVTAEVRRAFERDAERLTRRSAELFATAEAREGMAAFLERRDPAWLRAAREDAR